MLAPALLSLGRMPSPLRVALPAALLLGTVAAAQQAINLSFPGSQTNQAFNQSGCNNQVRVNWMVTGVVTTCQTFTIWVATGASCGDSPGTSATDGGSDLVLDTPNLSTATSGTESFFVSQMPGVAGHQCNEALDVKNAVCASLGVGNGTISGGCNIIRGTPLLTARYDTIPPDPPDLSVDPLDSKLAVHFAYNGAGASDILEYAVEYRPDGTDAGFTRISGISVQDPSQTISGLLNGTPYEIQGFAFDEANNQSEASAPVIATPEHSSGFWEEYKNAGGHEIGGCSATGAAVPSVIGALAALAALLGGRRRR